MHFIKFLRSETNLLSLKLIIRGGKLWDKCYFIGYEIKAANLLKAGRALL
jgi:hypothetical protein